MSEAKSYSGIVRKGEGRGKALGYPTANIPLTDDSLSGIYAARVSVGGIEYAAAVFVDTRRKLLEAHILDFTDDIYGKEMTVSLEKRLRESVRFTDEEKLKAAIAGDIDAVRAHFA